MSALLPSSTLFEQHQIRRLYDDATEPWWFSVIDIVQVLIDQPDFQVTRPLTLTNTAEQWQSPSKKA